MADEIRRVLTTMKPQSDAYRNPLLTAKPVAKGRISGRHSQIGGTDEFDRSADWIALSAGETKDIPAGALLQVRGAAGRLHSFVFEEDGSMHGPIHAAIHVRDDIQTLLTRPAKRQTKASVFVMLVLFLGLALFLFLKRAELALWSPTAQIELAVTLVIGWAVLCGLLLIGFKPARRIRKSSIEIAPPRSRL